MQEEVLEEGERLIAQRASETEKVAYSGRGEGRRKINGG